MNDDQIFISTQIQGRLDDWEAEEKRVQSIKSKLPSLKSRYAGQQAPDVKVLRTDVPKKNKRAKSQKQKKVKSITSHVTDTHKTSMLKILSGKKRKLNDIIKQIKFIEDQNLPEPEHEEVIHKENIIYDEGEWINIVKCINLKFPRLSRPSKSTLSAITQKYLGAHKDYEDLATLNKRADERVAMELQDSDLKSSLWHFAASPPPERLTINELRWLYNIEDDNQALPPLFADSSAVGLDFANVATLSQVLDCKSSFTTDQKDFDDLEIPKSSPEPEILVPQSKRAVSASIRPVADRIPQENLAVADSLTDSDSPVDGRQRWPRRGIAVEILSDLDSEENAQITHAVTPTPVKDNTVIEVPKSFTESAVMDRKSKVSEVERSNGLHEEEKSLIPIEVITSSPPDAFLRSRTINVSSDASLNQSQAGQASQMASILSSDLKDQVKGDAPSISSPQSAYSTAQSDFFYSERQRHSTFVFEEMEVPESSSNNKVSTESKITIKGRLYEREAHHFSNKKRKVGLLPGIIEHQNQDGFSSEEEISIITTKIIGVKDKTVDSEEIPNSSSDEDDISIIKVIREEVKADHECTDAIEVLSSQKENHSEIPQGSHSDDGSEHDFIAPNFEVNSEVEENELESEVEVEDFTKLNVDELKGRLKTWGLKVGKSKAKMVETLTQTSRLISQSQKSQRNSQIGTQTGSHNTQAKTHIFERISTMLKKDNKLYTSILLYKPLKVTELQAYLIGADINVEAYLLREYCDLSGIALLGSDLEKEIEDG